MSNATPPGTKHPCGCINYMDPNWKVQRSRSKCGFHVAAGGKTGMSHYEDMKAIINGTPQHERYERELQECLDEMGRPLVPAPSGREYALEIGCGLAMYGPWLERLGYSYVGLEPDAEAAKWVREALRLRVISLPYEKLVTPILFDLIVAAHVFEHLVHAPSMLDKTFDLLGPGGRLIMIVPDDQDPVNPDHLWFFTPSSLRFMLNEIGFEDIQICVRRRVKHENFLYVSAFRPN